MRVHVGCSGWFYSHWRGIFYPAQEVATTTAQGHAIKNALMLRRILRAGSDQMLAKANVIMA